MYNSSSNERDHYDDLENRDLGMSESKIFKLEVLRAAGFHVTDGTVMATVMNKYPRDAVDRFRTKCFLTEADRIASHKERIRVSTNKPKKVRKYSGKKGSKLRKHKDSTELMESTCSAGELDKPLYHEPVPIVPYPHRSKKVNVNGVEGFDRDQPTLAQRVLDRYRAWFA